MSLSSEFPNELLYHVVSFLADDRTSLANLSLVCRRWLPPTRSHLFHTVKLYRSQNSRQWGYEWNTDDFIHLLQSTTPNTIAPFIRDAVVDVWGRHLHNLFDALARAGVSLIRLQTSISCGNCQGDFDALRRIADQHQNLRELRVTYDGSFRFLEGSFIPALHFCSFFPNIRTLAFGMSSSWTIDDTHLNVPISSTKRIPLDDLHLTCCDTGKVLEWFRENILSPGFPRSLSLGIKLRPHNGFGPVAEFNSFLKKLGEGLRELKISIGHIYCGVNAPEPMHIDLRSSSNLRVFFAKIHDVYFIYNTLQSLPEITMLVSCHLNIVWETCHPRSDRFPCRNMEHNVWRKLARLHCLQNCRVVVQVPKSCSGEELGVLNEALSICNYELKFEECQEWDGSTLLC